MNLAPTTHHARARGHGPIVILVLMMVLLAACGTASGTEQAGADASPAMASTGGGEFLDASAIHDVSVTFDQADYEAMINTYSATGDKDWIAADVTIDGVTYENAGVRLKGNSSLRRLGGGGPGGPGGGGVVDTGEELGSTDPETLPWLIRLDKFVEDQNHEGIYDLVIRSNSSQSALNEAVALALLDAAGLASQDAAYAAFAVNGSDEVLRLVVEHPDDVWLEAAFSDAGVLYKAESTGDYSYRGDDPDAYDEVFDLEAGADNADLTPLMDFLDFINTSDDATFDAELADRLDVDAFATYLAMEDLIANFDDIDGPGNNSYLYYNVETGVFTVVPWDHNLAFGALERAGGAGGFGGSFTPPDGSGLVDGFSPPDGFAPGVAPGQGSGGRPGAPGGGEFAPPEGAGPGLGGGGLGGGPAGSNVLVDRFLANADWQALYDEKLAELQASLYDSGTAAEILDTWAVLLTTQAGGLIDDGVVAAEAEPIAEYFS